MGFGFGHLKEFFLFSRHESNCREVKSASTLMSQEVSIICWPDGLAVALQAASARDSEVFALVCGQPPGYLETQRNPTQHITLLKRTVQSSGVLEATQVWLKHLPPSLPLNIIKSKHLFHSVAAVLGAGGQCTYKYSPMWRSKVISSVTTQATTTLAFEAVSLIDLNSALLADLWAPGSHLSPLLEH